jgi:predicted HicB family RNase H-like nuclease
VTKRQEEPRDHPMTLRLPASLHKEVARAAVEDDRSMSAWIVVALEEAIAKYDRKRR